MVLFAVILVLEGIILYMGQRVIFAHMDNYSRKLALFFSAPGTALHEGAHWLMCKMLFVPTGRVELFRPRSNEDGSTQLGVVHHAQVDPLRQTLIAIAPLLLVPPLLLLIVVLFLGSSFFEDPLGVFLESSLWIKILLFYIFLSAGSAAFPSPGDHIPWAGGILLAGALVALLLVLPYEMIEELLKSFVFLLLPGSLSALGQIFFLHFISKRL